MRFERLQNGHNARDAVVGELAHLGENLARVLVEVFERLAPNLCSVNAELGERRGGSSRNVATDLLELGVLLDLLVCHLLDDSARNGWRIDLVEGDGVEDELELVSIHAKQRQNDLGALVVRVAGRDDQRQELHRKNLGDVLAICDVVELVGVDRDDMSRPLARPATLDLVGDGVAIATIAVEPVMIDLDLRRLENGRDDELEHPKTFERLDTLEPEVIARRGAQQDLLEERDLRSEELLEVVLEWSRLVSHLFPFHVKVVDFWW